MNTSKIKYSVIIPTLNEGKFIEHIIQDLKLQIQQLEYLVEIIISDGGSEDETLQICENNNVTIVNSDKGRGNQLREGAANSKGEILIFLHADLKIPEDFFQYLGNNFNENTKIATFRMKLDVNNLLYKVYSFFTRFDSIFTTFGDQGLIIRKDFYKSIGGYKKIPIMEDVDIIIRARSKTKIKKFNKNIIVSSRKFNKEGKIKNQFKSFICIIQYIMGRDPHKIYNFYYSINNEKKASNNSLRKIPRVGESKNQISFDN